MRALPAPAPFAEDRRTKPSRASQRSRRLLLAPPALRACVRCRRSSDGAACRPFTHSILGGAGKRGEPLDLLRRTEGVSGARIREPAMPTGASRRNSESRDDADAGRGKSWTGARALALSRPATGTVRRSSPSTDPVTHSPLKRACSGLAVVVRESTTSGRSAGPRNPSVHLQPWGHLVRPLPGNPPVERGISGPFQRLLRRWGL